MKKITILFCLILPLIFCSCYVETSGNSYELTSENWGAELDGGGKITLKFDGDTADLCLESSDKKATIKGKYIADDSAFVIFVPEIFQNYAFNYKPNGNTLDLTYDNSTITLKAE